MARPTTKRRLRDINPDDFGREVAERVKTHVTDLFLDRKDKTASRLFEHRLLTVEKEATIVAQYAQGGALDLNRACDVLFAVCARLYSNAGKAFNFDALEKLDIFPSDNIRVVLLAARARIRLGHREAVPVRELACLAGIDPDHARVLLRQGQMTLITGGVVAPDVAAKWLATRGVSLSS